jgi:diguanylate cyclase (GGDEF)-like protein
MERKLYDFLTGIGNEEYLKRNYHNYIVKYPNSNCIMIDFAKFKTINDTFGHKIGDNYLKLFAAILNDNFKDSIVTRIHGDEFVIVTRYDEGTILKKFNLCNFEIHKAFLMGKIPKKFKYNAGSTKADSDIDITLRKADYLMYQAKKDGVYYQKHSENLLAEKIKRDNYIKTIGEYIDNEAFLYARRELYNSEKESQNIFQIYTKDKNGHSIFSDNRYDYLKITPKIVKFDINNLKQLLTGADYLNCEMIISVDYRSLYAIHILLENSKLLENKINNIILSVNVKGLDVSKYAYVISEIRFLKSLGFQIRIDKFDNTIGDIIWERTPADYIKISNNYWKEAMCNKKVQLILKDKIKMYQDCGITTIMELIEKEEELEFLRELTQDASLFSGNLFSKEKQLILKKKLN